MDDVSSVVWGRPINFTVVQRPQVSRILLLRMLVRVFSLSCRGVEFTQEVEFTPGNQIFQAWL